MFSFGPRYRGLAGSRKYTGMSVAMAVAVVKDLCIAISEP